MSSPRKLLGVSWCMPPALFPRSVQVARLLKGLGRLGWQNQVVTPRPDTRPPGDPLDSSLAEAYAAAYRIVPVDLSRVDPEFGPRLARWRQRLAGEAGLTIDQLWMKRAAPIVSRAVRDYRPDVLVTFAQPWSDHRIGLTVADAHPSVPWVAHFSDPWVDSPYAANLPAEARDEALAHEGQVIARASRVVFTNQYAADLVMAKYPSPLRAKARVVPHAMDPDLTAAAAPPAAASGRAMTMRYVGNLFVGRRRAHAIFEALALLHAQTPLDGRVMLEILGEGSGLYEAREKAFELNLDAVVTFHPRVSYLDSLAAMAATDVLVLIDAPADVNLFLPSKIADYLMANRPVLAITPAVGPSADIMRQAGYPVVAPDDVAGIARTIQMLLDRHAARSLGPSPEAAAAAAPLQLEAACQAFAGILDETRRKGA